MLQELQQFSLQVINAYPNEISLLFVYGLI